MAVNEGKGPGGKRPPVRPPNSQGGKPNKGVPGDKTGKEADKELKKWLDRQERRALAGGLLSGPGGEGVGSAELVNLLRSNPELAVRVQQWMQENPGKPGLAGLMANAGAEGRQTQLLQAFPELYQQYVAATGKSIIYDADGNPIRLVDPSKPYGMREGDSVVAPTLFGAKGEELERPVIEDDNQHANFAPVNPYTLNFGATPSDGGLGGGSTTDQLLAARQRHEAAYGQYFSSDELVGGEE